MVKLFHVIFIFVKSSNEENTFYVEVHTVQVSHKLNTKCMSCISHVCYDDIVLL